MLKNQQSSIKVEADTSKRSATGGTVDSATIPGVPGQGEYGQFQQTRQGFGSRNSMQRMLNNDSESPVR